jgi:hypothetical protein
MATNTYVALDEVTVAIATPSITFTSIPQGYTDLVLVCNIAQVASNNSLRIRYNSDTGSNYSYTQLQGNGSTAVSGRDINLTSGLVAETTANTSLELAVIAHIQNYSNTTTYKTSIGRGNRPNGLVDATVSLWRSTAAITTIALSMGSGFPTNNFSSGSTFNLYGIANASITNTDKATGGDSVTTDGTYWYHTFLSSGTFTPTEALTADYLVVAGGGAGGHWQNSGGGGGSGGLRCTIGATGGGGSLESAVALTNGTAYTVTVGAGGATAGSYQVAGAQGSNSSISGSALTTITSIGGGGGGSGFGNNNGDATTGGSGGGGWAIDGNMYSNVGAAETPNQGYAGGNGVISGSYGFSGGGGGAGEAGNTDGQGQGGDGVATSISGTSTTYAGGGGGGKDDRAGGTPGDGGDGGGGRGGGGSGNRSATNATANTGSGGGGGGASGTTVGLGGSGIVIVRYAV